jgi:hypothetical protein
MDLFFGASKRFETRPATRSSVWGSWLRDGHSSASNERNADTWSDTSSVRALSYSRHRMAGVVFVIAFLIFNSSPLHPINDSKYSMMLSQCLLEHRSFQLDHYALPRLPPVEREDYVANGDIYQLEQVGSHIYYFFPPGSAVLSMPFVMIANTFRVSAVSTDGAFNLRGEATIEAWLAAFLMAVLASVFFYTAELVLPVGYSLLVTTGASLGTQIWSTASRAMFSDTWALLLLGVVIFTLLRNATTGSDLRPALIATLLAWTYFVYPIYALHIMAISAYLLFVFSVRQILIYMLTGVCWAAGLVFYSWHNFRQLLPNYFRPGRLHFREFWVALPGNLISPSRGLLVFVPTIFFVAYLLIRFRKRLPHRRLVTTALVAILLQLFFISGFDHWWGGHSYGPRLSTGVVPWLFLLAVLGMKAMLAHRAERRVFSNLRSRALLGGGLALLALSIFINARGAIALPTAVWNARPVNVDEQPARVWDWRQPQFLAGLLRPPQPKMFPMLEPSTRVDFTKPEAEKYLWYGWSNADPLSRWTNSTHATLIFSLGQVRPMTLRIKMAPFLVAGRLDEQRVAVRLNGRTLSNLSLSHTEPEVFSVSLPGEALQQGNILAFEIPDAASPASFRLSEDQRQLGIRVEYAEFLLQ